MLAPAEGKLRHKLCTCTCMSGERRHRCTCMGAHKEVCMHGWASASGRARMCTCACIVTTGLKNYKRWHLLVLVITVHLFHQVKADLAVGNCPYFAHDGTGLLSAFLSPYVQIQQERLGQKVGIRGWGSQSQQVKCIHDDEPVCTLHPGSQWTHNDADLIGHPRYKTSGCPLHCYGSPNGICYRHDIKHPLQKGNFIFRLWMNLKKGNFLFSLKAASAWNHHCNLWNRDLEVHANKDSQSFSFAV